MKVYFVRHGESEGNATRIWSGSETPLTDLGYKQAEFVANRLGKLPIDLVIASPYVRTQQTAEVIAEKLGKEIITSSLFTERKKPSEVEGLSMDDEKCVSVMAESWKNFYLPDYHHSDEENFEDLKSRAIKAIDFLKKQEVDHVVVVTHGLFLRRLLGVMVFGIDLNEREDRGTCRFIMQNTGVTISNYNKEKEIGLDTGWAIETWNDQAHLS
ncbi:MAG: histidine phosphatase family protein [Candidatus Vogelbacteria bacterium]|nr:histidine phosphatase family protein [Candidatus Vogelbacteria bacterium]